MTRFLRFIALFLIPSASALADLHFSRPLTPPKIDEIRGFANGPSIDFRISRDDFIGFLRRARIYTTLPGNLKKRGEAGELVFRSRGAEVVYDLHGVFCDERADVYFWQAIGPRFLVVVTEDGRGCFYFLDDKEPASLELRPLR